MTTISLERAEGHLAELLDEVTLSHEPVYVVGKDRTGVFLSEEDWRAIEETLYIQSVPGMTESLLKGFSDPESEYSNTIEW